ncbi:MAG TPA: hypothetical protein VGH28_08120 [Polyangiaceae bacterium]
MSYVTTFVSPIFFVRWTAPSADELPDVTAEYLEHRRRLARPLAYVAIVPEDCAVPDDVTRRMMVVERDKVLPECLTMHIVMEGGGFKHAILRNAMAAMQLVVGSRDKKVVIGRRLEEALAAIAKVVPEDMKFDVRSVMAKTLSHGVATPSTAKLGSA